MSKFKDGHGFTRILTDFPLTAFSRRGRKISAELAESKLIKKDQ